jgi:hypothetical protein
MVVATAALAAEDKSDPLPSLPQPIPSAWLSPARHPRWVCTPQDLAATRRELATSNRIQAFLKDQADLAARFAKMPAEALIALVPRPKSQFVYGLGMNIDPVYKSRMRWAGWNRPLVMLDIKGNPYPNAAWPDHGDGAADPKTGDRYYFVAQANAKIIQLLEQRMLPALADVYALGGSRPHARAAAVLLDAIANVYPTNRRGPLDYPTSSSNYNWGGRLDRPGYQVARGLVNYVHAIDLLAPSGELERPSHFAKGQTIREHVIRNLLWDGGTYCLRYARLGTALHNGQADYERGAALVGLLLGVRPFCEPLTSSPTRIYVMLANNLDQNGLYYEVSPMYAAHTRNLYVDMAEEVEAMRQLGWQGMESVYAQPAMRQFLTEPFNRQEVGGHVPMFGDDGPDRDVVSPAARLPDRRHPVIAEQLAAQIRAAWVELVRMPPGDRAASLLRNCAGGAEVVPPSDAWSIYHVRESLIERVRRQPLDTAAFETPSVFYGGKGLALLRGGRGPHRHGVQLFFGPEHNHGQFESLTWMFFARGAEWSFDPGYFNTHLRFGWTEQSVAHQSMVIDQTSVDPTRGSGSLLAWHAGADVQWAMAEHLEAHRAEGVTCYERLIAQAQQAPGGELAYWLDIGCVIGGRTRDDSFHTQMTRLEPSVALPPADPKRPSLFGRENLGRLLRADMRLRNCNNRPFGWAPPGEGYGFLGNPREMPMPATLRLTLSQPGFAKALECRLVADLLGAEGRRLIVADGPQMSDALPSVPYVLQRDAGPRPSVFAKLLRLVESGQSDPILAFEKLETSMHALAGRRAKPPVEAAAWCVAWKDGRRDLWVIGGDAGHWAVELSEKKLPKLHTDARVALVRLDRAGKVVAADASEATFLDVAGGPRLRGPARATGRIRQIDPAASPVVLDVAWDADWRSIDASGGSLAARSDPANGQATTWSVHRIDAHRAVMDEVTAVMGRATMEPQSDKPGWYRLDTSVSRFLSPSSHGPNVPFARGRAVYQGSRYVGRVRDVGPGATSLRIEWTARAVEGRQSFEGTILLSGPGDRLIVPLNLQWRASPQETGRSR